MASERVTCLVLPAAVRRSEYRFIIFAFLPHGGVEPFLRREFPHVRLAKTFRLLQAHYIDGPQLTKEESTKFGTASSAEGDVSPSARDIAESSRCAGSSENRQ